MGGLYSHTNRSTGDTVTAALYNADHQNHIDNLIPTMMDDYSADISTMRLTADPGESGSESLATTFADELKRLRFTLQEHFNTAYWYETGYGDGSVSATTIHAKGDTNTGLYFPGADQVGLATGGTAALTIDASQNITCGAGLTVTGAVTVNGAVTLGNASSDTLTINATIQGASPLVFEGGTVDAYETTIAITDPTADRTITIPNVTGTVITTGNLSSITSFGTLTSLTVTGATVLNGNVTIGDAAADTVTINGTIQGAFPLVFEGATANAYETTIAITDPTADRTITIPDVTGTVVTTGNLTAITSIGTLSSLTTSGAIVCGGNLTVNGTTTTVNSTTISVDDKNIELGSVATPTDSTADGGGLTLKGGTDKTIIWDNANDNWTANQHWNIASGKEFKINNVKTIDATSLGSAVVGSSLTSVGTLAQHLNITSGNEYRINATKVIDATSLGSAVVASSLTSVGTIATGTWSGTTVAVNKGGSGQTSYTNGQLLIGNSSGNTLAKGALTAGTGISVTNGGGSITIANTGSATLFQDADNDTKVQCEESSDEDKIRFDTSGTERLIVEATAATVHPHGTSTGNTYELRFEELAANGTNYVGIKSPDSIAANVVWQLPNADGSSGEFLKTNGSKALSWGAVGGGDDPYLLSNFSLAASVGSNALTIAIKGKDGNDPSSTNSCEIAFRNSTAANGTYTVETITTAKSIVLSSGSTLGVTASESIRMYVYAIRDGSNDVELGICRQAIFDESKIHTSTAEGGSGAADSNIVLYTTATQTNKPIRLIGVLEITSSGTAGQWDAAPTSLAVWVPGMRKTGDRVQLALKADTTTATGTTTIPRDNTIPQKTEGDEYMQQGITPTSSINLLHITLNVQLNSSPWGNYLTACLFQDTTANALAVTGIRDGDGNMPKAITLFYSMIADTTSTTTFKFRGGADGGGTTSFNGLGGTRVWGAAQVSTLLIEEIYV